MLGEGPLYYPSQNNLSSERRTEEIRQEQDIRGRRPSSRSSLLGSGHSEENVLNITGREHLRQLMEIEGNKAA